MEELKKQRTSIQQGINKLICFKVQGLLCLEFSALSELKSSQQESMCQLRDVEERVRVMEGLICEGQRLLDVYSVKLGTASMSTEQSEDPV